MNDLYKMEERHAFRKMSDVRERQKSDTSDYTLLVCTREGCSACIRYEVVHDEALRDMIRQQDRVSMQHVDFKTINGTDVFAPNPRKGKKGVYIHPQLPSYVMGYPTFILVEDRNYYNPKSDLNVFVYNRIIKDGKPDFGNKPQRPASIVMWISEKMDDVEMENTHYSSESKVSNFEYYSDSVEDGHHERFTEIVCDHNLLCQRKERFVDTLG